MTRLTRQDLESMLASTTGAVRVALPKQTFLDIVVMAHQAAHENRSSSFTLRELESLIFEYAEQNTVLVEENECKALVDLAMQVAPQVDPPRV
jgi:hypothetical protein